MRASQTTFPNDFFTAQLKVQGWVNLDVTSLMLWGKQTEEFDKKKSNPTAQKLIAGNHDMIIPVLTVPVAREDQPVGFEVSIAIYFSHNYFQTLKWNDMVEHNSNQNAILKTLCRQTVLILASTSHERLTNVQCISHERLKEW